MKQLYLLLVTFMLCAVNHAAAETKVMFLTAGQSNTDGRVPAKDLPDFLKEPIRMCKISYHCGYNPERAGRFYTFQAAAGGRGNSSRWTYDAVVYHHIAEKSGIPFYVVKCSQGGTSLNPMADCSGRMAKTTADNGEKTSIPFYGVYDANGTFRPMYGKGYHWSADSSFLADTEIAGTVYEKDGNRFTGQSLLKAWMSATDAAIDSIEAGGDKAEIKAVMWHQGESDYKTPAGYHDSMKGMIAYVRRHIAEKLGDKKYLSLPFYLGTVPHSSRMYNADIENAMKKLGRDDANVHVIDLSDLSVQSDKLHFDASSAEIFGERLWKRMKKDIRF